MYPIHKIHRLFGHILSVTTWSYLHLSCKHLLSNLLSILAQIRSFSHQELKSYDADGIVISSKRMIFPHQNLRRHIPWSSTGLIRILSPPISRYSKISDATVSLLVKNDILRFQIPVNDIFGMKVVQSFHNASDDKFYYS